MPIVKPLFNAFVLGLVLASIYPTIAVGYFGSTPGTFKVTDDGARGLEMGSAAMIAAGERDFNKLLMSKVRFIVKL